MPTVKVISGSSGGAVGYGQSAGRTIRCRAGGRDAGYNSVTTSMVLTTNVAVPLAEPFISTGLLGVTNGVQIPSNAAPGWYEITYALKFAGGTASGRNAILQINGVTQHQVNTYGVTTTPLGRLSYYLFPSDTLTLMGYVETTGVTVTADTATAVFLDVVKTDKPKVQPMLYGWSQQDGTADTVASVSTKRETLNIWCNTSTWNDVQGDLVASSSTLAAFVAANPTQAVDVAGPLIPSSLASNTWDAALDAVTAGTNDARFTTLGTNLATYGPQTVYYRPWWEFNLTKYQPTAAKFIAAWNHAIPLVRAAFAAAAPTKTLKIVWCFTEGADPAPWYPDPSTVDVISADVYAMVFGTTTPSFTQLATKITAKLSILAHYGALKGKPIAISEFAQCVVQPGTTTFQGRGDEPGVMDLYFDFFENTGTIYACYFNLAGAGVGQTFADIPNTAARVASRRALISRVS